MKKTPTILLLTILVAIAGSSAAAPIRLRAETIQPNPKTSGAQIAAAYPARGYYILQFKGPVKEAWRSALQQLGVKLADYIPDYAFIAQMAPDQVKRAIKLDFVEWIGRLKPQHRFDPNLLKADERELEVLIRTPSDEPRGGIKQLIQAKGGKVLDDSSESGEYLLAKIPANALGPLSKLEGVLWIEKWTQPRLANNVAEGITGVTTIRDRCGLFGSGQILAFADSGLDSGNPSTLSVDFANRLVKAYDLRRPGDWSDLMGHGTHIAGTAVGSGILSGSNPAMHSYNGSFAGVAPEAGFIMQSIGDESGYVYPPLNLADLFQPPYQDGARIHNNSWGSPAQGAYAVYSQQLDEFTWNHKDFVVVFVAGNDGEDWDRDGITDMDQIYSPGTAKNCITVGATESDRNTGRITTYYEAWGTDFPANPIREDYISDDPGGMVAWSSRGPCDDGRIKPDICAPGTNIVSCRSHAALNPPGWVTYDANYVYWGGTSMSTPMVAGAAALVREDYIKSWGIQPSSALVKAALLNGAKELSPGQYVPHNPPEIPQRPNSVEGWGRLDLSSTIEPLAPKVIESVEETGGLATGEFRTYQHNILGSSLPLAVTLVWTDPPGSPLAAVQLVNDLNLTVVGPDNHQYFGNGTVDSINNVEGVDIPSPSPGIYTVTVTAANVPIGPQPFALVVSGELPGSYIAGVVRTASGNPISGAKITAASRTTTRATSTAANGAYTIHMPYGTYSVGPLKAGWSFTPVRRSVTVGETGVNGVDFTGSAPLGSIGGMVTQLVGGMTSYVVESPHPYYNSTEQTFVITAHPSVTNIRVHFEEIAVQEECDFLLVEDMAGNVKDQFTGELSDQWSSWVAGNAIKVRLVSDSAGTDYGFYLSGYETDIVPQGGLKGVTLTIAPNGETGVSQPNGSYIVENLEPVTHSIAPSLAKWTFQPQARTVDVSPGGGVSNVDFSSLPPGVIAGVVTTGTVAETELGPSNPEHPFVESSHPYPVEEKLTYEVRGSSGTGHIRVHFSEIAVEELYDYLLVTDAEDNVIDEYTGTYSNVWSSWVAGDMLKIVLISDESLAEYGFLVDKFTTSHDEHGISGVTVTLQPGGVTAATNPSGAFTFAEVQAGQYSASAAKTYWAFEPDSRQLNSVPGMTTETALFGLLQGMPNITSVKSLPDGEQVLLSGKVVTAGSDQLPGAFYIEETDRSSGIRVATSKTISEGNAVDVAGTLGTADGERQITAMSVTVVSESATVPDPLGMPVRSLGGGSEGEHTPGVWLGAGLNNVGLLVKVFGNVVSSGSGYFWLDDGSTAGDPEQTPLRAKVICPSGVTPPNQGSFVVVTGISSCDLEAGKYVRAVRARKNGDISPVE